MQRANGGTAMANRPLVPLAIAFALGIIVSEQGFCDGLVLPIAVLCLGLGLGCWEHRPDIVRPLSGAVCLFAAGALLWNAHHRGPRSDELAMEAESGGGKIECVVEGRVRLTGLEQAATDYHRFLVDVDIVETDEGRRSIAGGTSVSWASPDSAVQASQRVRIRGSACTALARMNPGTNSYEDYLRGQGIHTSIRANGPRAVTVLETPRWSVLYWMSRLRTAQAAGLARVVPADALPFVQAVWLGYRTSMPDDEYQAYLSSGTIHILSVSGLHMAMVYATASFLVSLYVRKPRTRAVLCMVAVAMFTLMSGMRPSALRSAVMVFVYLIAELLEREPDAPTALSESALLLLVVEPELLFNGGFQLSFLCVASMLLFSERVTRGLAAVPPFLREALGTSLAVQLLPLPLAILYFHVFPTVGAVANLLLVPLSTLALWLCLVASLCCAVAYPLALLFGQALGLIVSVMRTAAELLTAPAFSHWYLPSPTPTAVAAYYLVLGLACQLLWHPPKGRRRRRLLQAGLVCTLLAVVTLWSPVSTTPRLVALDVGQGDAIFAQSKGGHTVLVDTGFRRIGDKANDGDAARKTIGPFLWANHVTRLDAIVITHAHTDHIGGAAYLLEHFEVGRVLIGPSPGDSQTETELRAICERRGVPVQQVWSGDVFALPEMVFTVLHPPDGCPDGNGDNNGSLVLRLNWDGAGILLTGDIEAAAESRLQPEECQAAVLKVPHHGSRTSSSPRFVESVSPAEAIISVGGADRAETLAPEVVSRYMKHGVRVWRTDLLGGIDVRRAGSGFALTSTRAARGYPTPSNELIDEQAPATP